jgi:uncharacterized protein YoxC
MADQFMGGVGVVIALVVIAFAIAWAVFPFVLFGKLKRQQKTLDQIERNTRQATEK